MTDGGYSIDEAMRLQTFQDDQIAKQVDALRRAQTIIRKLIDQGFNDEMRGLSPALAAINEAIESSGKTLAEPADSLWCSCGRPHLIDTVLPSEIWNRIAAPHVLLCMTCIDERLHEHGLEAEAEFYFVGKALKSRLYSDTESGEAT